MDELELRAAIVAEALTWERTPYHSHAALKGVGVDCAQLPIETYSALEIIPRIRPEYSQQWMNHRDEELYLEEIRHWAREIEFAEIKPADLVVWKFGRTFSHSAIVIEPPIVLHAVLKGGAVIRADIERDEELRTRPRKAFSVFDENGRLISKKKRR